MLATALYGGLARCRCGLAWCDHCVADLKLLDAADLSDLTPPTRMKEILRRWEVLLVKGWRL